MANPSPTSILWSISQVKLDLPLLGLMTLTRDVWRICSSRFRLCLECFPITLYSTRSFQTVLKVNIWNRDKILQILLIKECARSSLLSPSKPASPCPTDVILIYESATLCEKSYLLFLFWHPLDLKIFAEQDLPLRVSFLRFIKYWFILLQMYWIDICIWSHGSHMLAPNFLKKYSKGSGDERPNHRHASYTKKINIKFWYIGTTHPPFYIQFMLKLRRDAGDVAQKVGPKLLFYGTAPKSNLSGIRNLVYQVLGIYISF